MQPVGHVQRQIDAATGLGLLGYLQDYRVGVPIVGSQIVPRHVEFRHGEGSVLARAVDVEGCPIGREFDVAPIEGHAAPKEPCLDLDLLTDSVGHEGSRFAVEGQVQVVVGQDARSDGGVPGRRQQGGQ